MAAMKLSVNPCKMEARTENKDNQRPNDGLDAEFRQGEGHGKLYSPEFAVNGADNKANRKVSDDDFPQGEEHGKLYSPDFAIKGAENKANRKVSDDDFRQGEDHGTLYSPEFAVKGAENKANGKVSDDDFREGEEHGKLYSPEFAIKRDKQEGKQSPVISNFRSRERLSVIKEQLLDKLAALPIPAESLENARSSIETIVRDATHAAYGMTKEAAQRIKQRLLEVLPSLSSNETTKLVDDVEHEVLDTADAADASNLEALSENVQNNSDSSLIVSEQSLNQSVAPTDVNAINVPLRARL